MTVGQLLFAVAATAFLLISVAREKGDQIATFAEQRRRGDVFAGCI
jgi:hypothetical protein